MLPQPGIEDVLEYDRALGLALSQAEGTQHAVPYGSAHRQL